MATGSKGVGTVVSVRDTGMTVNDNPRVEMVFRVEPLDGSAALDLTKKTTVSRVEIPRQGDRYPVWYDPSDLTPGLTRRSPTTGARVAATDVRRGRRHLRRDGRAQRRRRRLAAAART